MQYSAVSGSHYTWQDRVDPVAKHVTSHNWLPAGVASMAIFWIALLFIAINQTLPVGPGADVTQPQHTATHMSVSTVPINNPVLTNNSVNSNAPGQASSSSNAPSNLATPAMASVSTLSPVIGGKGAATNTLPSISTEPVAQAVQDVPTVALPAPSTVVPDPVTVPDVNVNTTVDTPLTSDPITIDLSTNNEGVIDLGL